MALTLSDFALIAEIISAFAIVVSLVFVGFQLKDNAKATRSATANATISTICAWYSTMGQNEQASAMFFNGMENPAAFSREQWFQFVFGLHALMLVFQNSYYLGVEGTLNYEIRDSLTAVIAAAKDQPGFVRYWAQRRAIFLPEFQAYVDSLAAPDVVSSEGLYRHVGPDEAPP